MKPIFGTRPIDYLPPLVLLAFTAAYISAAYTYKPAAALFPLSVAWVTVVLLLLDLVSRSKTGFGQRVDFWLNAATAKKDNKEAEDDVSLSRQLLAIGGVTAFLVLSMVIGMFYAVPIYVYCSMRYMGKKSLVFSAAGAVGVGVFVYLMFGLFLGVELFPGLIMGGEL